MKTSHIYTVIVLIIDKSNDILSAYLLISSSFIYNTEISLIGATIIISAYSLTKLLNFSLNSL